MLDIDLQMKKWAAKEFRLPIHKIQEVNFDVRDGGTCGNGTCSFGPYIEAAVKIDSKWKFFDLAVSHELPDLIKEILAA